MLSTFIQNNMIHINLSVISVSVHLKQFGENSRMKEDFCKASEIVRNSDSAPGMLD